MITSRKGDYRIDFSDVILSQSEGTYVENHLRDYTHTP